MAEEVLFDSFPDLRELENKVGRKIPESLLVWMRDDAADKQDGWSADVGVKRRGDGGGERSSVCGDSFSEKLSNLKQEMKWLRCADVRILRQLVTVHEGIEAMRWLLAERSALTSRGSSLTGSVSSLVTAEEAGPSVSPCRKSPTFSPDVTDEDSADHTPHTDAGHSVNRSCSNTLSPESSGSKSGVSCSVQAWSGSANGLFSANFPKSQPPDALSSGDFKASDPIRKALLRSCKAARGDVMEGAESVDFAVQSAEPKQQTQKTMTEQNDSSCNTENVLLGYDAQWCWVESQDDVTFL